MPTSKRRWSGAHNLHQKSFITHYKPIRKVTTAALALGRGTLMAKMDIKEAYRLAPVHPEDRLLPGMTWQDTCYIDKTLPFGLRSAPLIFTALADGLEWVIR